VNAISATETHPLRKDLASPTSFVRCLVLEMERSHRRVLGSREATVGVRPTSCFAVLFCLTLSLAGCIGTQAFSQTSSSETLDLIQAETADTISFQEKVAFFSPSGEEIIPSPGIYRVEPVGPSALRLVPFGNKEAFVIKAQSRTHDEDVGFPIALMAVDDEELCHVLLLLPEQKGLEAIGSSSRGRFRGLPELLTPLQIHDALMQKKPAKP
jgi:hypothetical protein